MTSPVADGAAVTGTQAAEPWTTPGPRDSRLSVPAPLRIPAVAALSFTVGMGLGLVQGSTMAGLRFRAEHAHKLPQTSTGWYLYHKSKNYNVALGGIKEGLRMGAKVSFWTTAMLAIENMFDSYRGTMDFANTVLACVTVAGAFSLWRTFPFPPPPRSSEGRNEVADQRPTPPPRPFPAGNGGKDDKDGVSGWPGLRRVAGCRWRGKGAPDRIY